MSIEPVSSSPDLALDFVMNYRGASSCRQRIILVTSDVAWTILSGAICFPPVVAALSEATGSTLHQILGFGSAAGTGLDWFVLTAYGGVVLIHALPNRSQAEIVLFNDKIPRWTKVLQVAVSIGLGLATRAPSLTEAVRFNTNKTLGFASGFVSAIGEAGLPALGQYLQFELAKKYFARRCSRDKRRQKIELIRERLIGMTQVALRFGLKSSREEREIRFRVLYGGQAQDDFNRVGQGFKELLGSINQIYQDENLEANCGELYFRKWPRAVLQASGSLSCVGLFVMDALLAQSAYEILHANRDLTNIGMVLAVVALLYLAPKMTWEAAGVNYDLIYDLLGGIRQDKSFGDEFYPKLSKLLKTLCALLSLLQYDEQIALTKLYVPLNTWGGRLLSLSNIIACSLMISSSFYSMIDEMLERYSLSSYASHEIQHAALLKQKLGRFITLLQNIHPAELSTILNSLDDPELKQTLEAQMLSLPTISAYVASQAEESTPLLSNRQGSIS